MFGLGFGEIVLIVAVALVVVGPKKLPEIARLIARGMAEFRRHSDDIQRTIHREIHTPLRSEDLFKTTEAQVYPGPPPGDVPKEAAAPTGTPPPSEPTA